eukprot:4223573-Ditylum_brightwellii.AAC.1
MALLCLDVGISFIQAIISTNGGLTVCTLDGDDEDFLEDEEGNVLKDVELSEKITMISHAAVCALVMQLTNSNGHVRQHT